MNPMQTLTQREQAIKQQIVEAKAKGVWGEPLAALERQLANLQAEKRRTLESITGMKIPLIKRPNPNAINGTNNFTPLIMGIPDFLLKP